MVADKTGMDILGIALQGLQQADGRFDQAAQNMTQTTLSTGESQSPTDSLSLSDAAVSLMTAANQYDTQVAVAHTAGEMQQATLSLLA